MMDIYYENHKGQTVNLCKRPYKLLDIDDLYTISRDYNQNNGKITSFQQKTARKSFDLDILSTKEITWKAAADELYQILETDIANETAGKLYVGEYYLPCYIYLAAPDRVNLRNPYVTCTFTLVSDQPTWLRSDRYSYLYANIGSVNERTKRYAYRYPYRYHARVGTRGLYNPLSAPAHFQFIVYGPVNNPAIMIGGYLYQVFVDLHENERLMIDYSSERTRTIVKYTADGNSEDVFNKRNKEISIFKKINPGKQIVNWSGEFSFDLVLFDERSQPKWI